MQPDVATEDLASAIGWIAVESARLEVLAAQLAAAIIGTPTALNVLIGQGWSSTYEALKVLAQDRIARSVDGNEVDDMNEMLAALPEAKKLMEQRNDVVHSIWQVPNGSGHDGVRLKRWARYNARITTVVELQELRASLRSMIGRLDALFSRAAERAR